MDRTVRLMRARPQVKAEVVPAALATRQRNWEESFRSSKGWESRPRAFPLTKQNRALARRHVTCC
jgi:hypothetical protein